MRNSDENRHSAVENFRFSSSFVIHSERWFIKLKWKRGEEERGSITKAKTTKCRPVGEVESERGGCLVLKAEGGIGAVDQGERSDRWHGASMKDPT
ncbi:hypothetical protein AVEN_121398-1 [Araneus ventricosus]|uniref:Uncharacterized protein n=1 Tax=Araneus ventricosus TaxID=182803 RepID=A0A4Y2CPJ8_ARAVE|nr:hypothetical protein AVEN_121398-1 [Araneus ventricosus]